MRECVCLSACACACLCARAYAYARACTHHERIIYPCFLHVHACTCDYTVARTYIQRERELKRWSNGYIHTHTHTYIHTYVHTYIHTYIHTYLHTYIPTYIHTYIHTYTHTRTHARTHTPIYRCQSGSCSSTVLWASGWSTPVAASSRFFPVFLFVLKKKFCLEVFCLVGVGMVHACGSIIQVVFPVFLSFYIYT